jgi:hypothetical protein
MGAYYNAGVSTEAVSASSAVESVTTPVLSASTPRLSAATMISVVSGVSEVVLLHAVATAAIASIRIAFFILVVYCFMCVCTRIPYL